MDYCQQAGTTWNRTAVSPINSGAGSSSGGHRRSTGVSPASDRSSQSGGNYLNNQIGRQVKINRGGPESLMGKLVAIHNNYVVLQTNEGIVYINASHVKSVTELTSQKSQGWTPKYITAGSFNGVLQQMVKSFAQINWGGPEKIEGFIADVGSDYLLMVVGGQDLVRIPLYHIKTVKAAGKYVSSGNRTGGNKTGGSQSDNNHSGGNKSNSNKSGNHKSGGQKSGNNKSGGNKSNNKHRTGGSGNRTNRRGTTNAATSSVGRAKRTSARRANKKS